MQLGHTESEVLNLLQQLPGQPFALRTADGNDNDGPVTNGAATDEVPADTADEPVAAAPA